MLKAALYVWKHMAIFNCCYTLTNYFGRWKVFGAISSKVPINLQRVFPLLFGCDFRPLNLREIGLPPENQAEKIEVHHKLKNALQVSHNACFHVIESFQVCLRVPTAARMWRFSQYGIGPSSSLIALYAEVQLFSQKGSQKCHIST